MSELTPSLEIETKALRGAYAGLNRNDIPTFVKILDPQVEWIEPAEIPGGGTYRGLAAVTAHVSQARESWAEGSCEPRRFIVAGDRIIVLAYVRVRLSHEAQWREGQIADVYTFRGGKVIQKRTFTDSREALEWAGVNDPDAGSSGLN